MQKNLVSSQNLCSQYRFSFNGKESDNEVKGFGNSLDFGARIYDSRLGRWLSVDPLHLDYPWASPYNFVLNNSISNIDPNGEWVERTVIKYKGDKKLSKLSFHKADKIVVDIKIHQAKIYNASSKVLDNDQMLEASKEIKKDILDVYNTTTSNGKQTIVTTATFEDDFEVVSDLNTVKSRKNPDNLWVIADENAVSLVSGRDAGAFTTAGSNLSIIGINSFSSISGSNLVGGMGQTASHEFGHQLGRYGHNKKSPDSFMYPEEMPKKQVMLFADAKKTTSGSINQGIDMSLIRTVENNKNKKR